ncbi:bifunctional riboflavin kinase/FAD synthetase [Anaerosalibacter bizertensis]|uniref:Riboflavin biosynthesis protein n=1 Tax=Anaerosalibacter bizertensis TaxID=932217 RepID=A0A9Q4FLD4_9FIRM|nr:bifunctional riboflavin kinase/FAD synthetase [Anaerosalibacter bizertensis]MBV1818569.1 bifunctional riboflavin kinase/FAD synthetase [Bacteroidales bacterium MSK.15.36]MCG4564607.1 bifunctional riboflavin kinase/FAD synthetase [Anaerosalibacter bizertensis]MCG4582263.1 bifunctional riboflavin kinase/FAD synthetase [Anaerosalibacter bizertensis]
MEMISYDKNERVKGATAVALGNFDGLHIGHQQLIKTMVHEGKKKELKTSVLLFTTHTKNVINKDKKPNMLTSNNQKIELLESIGVEMIYSMNFNEDIMRLSPKQFVEDILIDKLHVKLVVVGFNYRFGYKAKGDSNYLKELGKELGFEVIVVEPVYGEEEVISSTLIRKLLREGNIKKANDFLGRPYEMEGKVVAGNKRGKGLGFPTANLKLDEGYLIPRFGVYKTITMVNGKEHLSLTNVGENPTFNDYDISVESYILDFNQDIYGEKISIKFLQFHREEIKFNKKEELIDQMLKDVENIKNN